MSNVLEIKESLVGQLNRLNELKQELKEKEEELDRTFKRRTEIHEGAPATKEEVSELDNKFLKCRDDIDKIGEEIIGIQKTCDSLIEQLKN